MQTVTADSPLQLEPLPRGFHSYVMQTKGPGYQQLNIRYDLMTTEDEWKAYVATCLGKLTISLFMSGIVQKLRGDRYIFSLLPMDYLTKWVQCNIPSSDDPERLAALARGTIMDADSVHYHERTKKPVHFELFHAPPPRSETTGTGDEDSPFDCPCCFAFVPERERFQWCPRCKNQYIHVKCMAGCMVRSGKCPTCNMETCMLNEKIHILLEYERNMARHFQAMRAMQQQQQQQQQQQEQQQAPTSEAHPTQAEG